MFQIIALDNQVDDDDIYLFVLLLQIADGSYYFFYLYLTIDDVGFMSRFLSFLSSIVSIQSFSSYSYRNERDLSSKVVLHR